MLKHRPEKPKKASRVRPEASDSPNNSPKPLLIDKFHNKHALYGLDVGDRAVFFLPEAGFQT
jgi:hypothetical protein